MYNEIFRKQFKKSFYAALKSLKNKPWYYNFHSHVLNKKLKNTFLRIARASQKLLLHFFGANILLL